MKKPRLRHSTATERKQYPIVQCSQWPEEHETLRITGLGIERVKHPRNLGDRTNTLKLFNKVFIIPNELKRNGMSPDQQHGGYDQSVRPTPRSYRGRQHSIKVFVLPPPWINPSWA